MSQPAGFSYLSAVSRWPALPARPVAVGGVTCTCAQAQRALAALAAAGGIMVAQVLRGAGSPLAGCDYHAAAAPFLLPLPAAGGRGAAGRPVTRTAFMRAIAAVLDAAARAEPARHFASRLDAARDAFGSDAGYAAAMASAAVAVLEREHAARLAAVLSAGVRTATAACEARRGEFSCAAVSACGTGDCRLASSRRPLAGLAVPAGPGRVPRPGNHERAGRGFGTSAALAALGAAVPFDAAAAAGTVRVSGSDCARGG